MIIEHYVEARVARKLIREIVHTSHAQHRPTCASEKQFTTEEMFAVMARQYRDFNGKLHAFLIIFTLGVWLLPSLIHMALIQAHNAQVERKISQLRDYVKSLESSGYGSLKWIFRGSQLVVISKKVKS